jgi:hypothetical protein
MRSVLVTLTFATFALTAAFDPSSKQGLAWPNGVHVPMAGFTSNTTTISSYYTWSPDPVIPNTQSSLYSIPFPFIPMLWGCNSTYTAPFAEAVRDNFSDVALTSDKVILGFNEPNQVGQAECTPQEAADAWMTYLEPLKAQGYRLGSPAVTSAPDGLTWMQEWLRICAGRCNPDFIALHWVS